MVAMLGFSANLAVAAQLELSYYEFYLDGDLYVYGDTVPGIDDSGFDWSTGLGTLTLVYNPADAVVDGDVDAWFVHDIYEDNWDVGGDDLNTIGGTEESTSNYTQFGEAGTLDQKSDAWMWMGYGNISFEADEEAAITWIISETIPDVEVFYLSQQDDIVDNGAGYGPIYLTSTITIRQSAIPEPSTILMFGAGLLVGWPVLAEDQENRDDGFLNPIEPYCNTDSDNVIRVVYSGSTYISWVRVKITRGGATLTECVYDYNCGGCDEMNRC